MLRPCLGQPFSEVSVVTMRFGKARKRQQLYALAP
jgi:hypothetical protein